MLVGVPREVKNHEYRVAITPAGVRELTGRGHDVLLERDAGAGAGLPDADFVAAGARISADAAVGEGENWESGMSRWRHELR
jgi:alanine dehydrogenase